MNTVGGGARVALGETTFNPTPANAGFARRNLGLTEEVELAGPASGSFTFRIQLIGGVPHTSEVSVGARRPSLDVAGPAPSPSSGATELSFALARGARVRYEILDATGRRLVRRDLGWRGPGGIVLRPEPRDASGRPLHAGVYFVRIAAGSRTATKRWVLVR